MNGRTLIYERVDEANAGVNTKVVCRVESGWVVMGDVQPVAGYSLLLPDPVVPSLNHLDDERRAVFLADMTRLGDALLAVTEAARINYDILGNSEPALHAHVFPRYEDEPDEFRTWPAFMYDWREAAPFGPAQEWIRQALRKHLAEAI